MEQHTAAAAAGPRRAADWAGRDATAATAAACCSMTIYIYTYILYNW